MSGAKWKSALRTALTGILLSGPVATPALGADATAAAAKPDPKAAAAEVAAVNAAVNAAVAAIAKEAQTAYRSGDLSTLRDKSNYFGEALPPGITPASVLAALERTLDRDPRVDAYVKWQLMSAFPSQFEPEQLPRVLQIYRRAPEPLNHPGLDHAQLQGMLFKVGIMNKDLMPKLNDQYKGTLDKLAADNKGILGFRTALYAHLPATADAAVAGLADAYVRVRHGINAQDFWNGYAANVKAWAITADPREVTTLLKPMGDLLAVVKDGKTQPFTAVQYADQGNTQGLNWKSDEAIWDKSIQDLIDSLKDAIKNNASSAAAAGTGGGGGGGGGLNFRDDAKDAKKDAKK